MALTRDQALDLLRTMRREDLSDPDLWYEQEWEGPPKPKCKVCPVLALAIAGGFALSDFDVLLAECEQDAGEALQKLQPYTGLRVDELKAVLNAHDSPISGEPPDTYVAAVEGRYE